MKIRRAIRFFKKLLPIYEKAIKEQIVPECLELGICCAIHKYCDRDFIDDIFTPKGYYASYLGSTPYICPTYHYNFHIYPNIYPSKKIAIKKTIVPRRDFLKAEIEDLQRLLDEGYTDI